MNQYYDIGKNRERKISPILHDFIRSMSDEGIAAEFEIIEIRRVLDILMLLHDDRFISVLSKVSNQRISDILTYCNNSLMTRILFHTEQNEKSLILTKALVRIHNSGLSRVLSNITLQYLSSVMRDIVTDKTLQDDSIEFVNRVADRLPKNTLYQLLEIVDITTLTWMLTNIHHTFLIEEVPLMKKQALARALPLIGDSVLTEILRSGDSVRLVRTLSKT
jgi:hypothetical protein